MLHRHSNTRNTYCAIGNLQYTYGMERLGALIATARERSGLKGYELARRLGKQPSYVSRLEGGGMKTLPPPEELHRIGQAIGLSVDEMLRAAGYDVGGDETADALAAVYRRLDPSIRKMIDNPATLDRWVRSAAHTADMLAGLSLMPATASPGDAESPTAPVEARDARQDR